MFRFKHANPEDPAQVPNGFISDCADNSLEIKPSVADKSLLCAKVFDKFQFERMGFFSVDPDSTANKVSCNSVLSNHSNFFICFFAARIQSNCIAEGGRRKIKGVVV